MNLKNLEEKILNIDSSNLNESDIKAIEETVASLDKGQIRVAEESNGEWIINEWVREAVLLFFSINISQKSPGVSDSAAGEKKSMMKNCKKLLLLCKNLDITRLS